MKGKTHAGIGAFTYVALCDKFLGGFSYMGLLVVVISALIPDIDHPKGIVNQYILPFKNAATKKVLYTCSGILILWYDYLYTHESVIKALGISFIAVALSSHRNGLTHSLMGMITFGSMMGYLGTMYHVYFLIHWFMLGYTSHLVADMFTNQGIPLFYPFVRKKFKFPLTYKVGSRTGATIENMILVGGVLYTVWRMSSIFK